MNVEEKLAYFTKQIQTEANQNIREQVDQYQEVLQSDFDQIIADTRKNYINRLVNEKNNIRKQNNKKLAQAQMKQQRDLFIREEELKKIIFKRFTEALEDYKKTDHYVKQLKVMMNSVIDYADNIEKVEIYLDESDANLVDSFKQQTGFDVRVSDRPFIGGVRGVLRQRDILIDYSFETLLERQREQFTLEGSVPTK